LGRPDGNLTGLMTFEASVVGKWLVMLEEIKPSLRRAALVGNRTDSRRVSAQVTGDGSGVNCRALRVGLDAERSDDHLLLVRIDHLEQAARVSCKLRSPSLERTTAQPVIHKLPQKVAWCVGTRSVSAFSPDHTWDTITTLADGYHAYRHKVIRGD
jgi:hypothetical protein